MESKAPTHYTFCCQKNNYSNKVLIPENSTLLSICTALFPTYNPVTQKLRVSLVLML